MAGPLAGAEQGASWLRASTFKPAEAAAPVVERAGRDAKRKRERGRDGDEREGRGRKRERERERERGRERERRAAEPPRPSGRGGDEVLFHDSEGDRGLHEFGTANAYELSVYTSSRRSAETLRSMGLVPDDARSDRGDRFYRSDFLRTAARRARHASAAPRGPSTPGTPLDEVVSLLGDGASDPGEAAAAAERERVVQLNRDVQVDPHDVGAWLRLARNSMAPPHAAPAGRHAAARRGMLLKAQSVLERALESNPGDEALLLELMRNGAEVISQFKPA